MEYVMAVALLVAGVAAGIAYGYRNERDREANHSAYLRDQITKLMVGR